jgi:cytochrome c biogenesis protein CcmG/thiol:disulfide interchange protein DsbE
MSESKKMNYTGLVVGILVVFAIGYAFISAGEQSDPKAQIKNTQSAGGAGKEAPGDPRTDVVMAPDFTLVDLAGDQQTLSEYKGKVVFVNFWATWCGPCRQEIPYFIELTTKYKDQGFEVLGIALDPREFDKVPGFVDQIGINYPVMTDVKGVSNMYGGIRSIPTTFVVDREGYVVEMIVGSRPKDEFERIIKQNLE